MQTTARRVDAVWLLLSLVTVAAALLARLGGRSEFSPSTAVTVAVVAIAAFKVRLVVRQFMEVRAAPPWLRRLTDGWVLTLLGSILGIYLLSPAQ